MKGRGTEYHHPTNDTETVQLYWETAQTATNRRHGPGCELGVGVPRLQIQKKKHCLEECLENAKKLSRTMVYVCVCGGGLER